MEGNVFAARITSTGQSLLAKEEARRSGGHVGRVPKPLEGLPQELVVGAVGVAWGALHPDQQSTDTSTLAGPSAPLAGPSAPMRTREFQDRLLVALYTEASKSNLGAYLDPRKVADEVGLVRRPGLLRLVVDDLEAHGYVEASKTLGGGDEGGLDLHLTGSGIAAAEDLLDQHPEYADLVPAAGRYVRLSDNRRGELGDDLKALRRAVISSNDADDENRQIALSEIAVFETTLVQSRVPQELVERFVDRVLKWIAAAFGAALVGKVCEAIVIKLLPMLA